MLLRMIGEIKESTTGLDALIFCCLSLHHEGVLGISHTNAQNVSSRVSVWWPIHIINSVDKTKLS